MTSGTIIIAKGREKPILQQHPWIFSGAIESVRGNPSPGEIVTVTTHDGTFLARGYWNPKSQIQVRILTWRDEAIDDDWWRRMLKRAIDARFNDNPEAIHQNWDAVPCRMINAENDYLPGLVVDCYSEENRRYWLVLQALTLGIDQRKTRLTELLLETLQQYPAFASKGIAGVYERSDVDVRGKEGLKQVTGVLWGEEPPERFFMQDSEYILIDIRAGHKTGYYLDQAVNRFILLQLVYELAQDEEHLRLLNLFSYTGAFGLRAMRDGVHVTNVDASREALEMAEASAERSGASPDQFEFIQADVFEYLRDIREQGPQFDVVVLDPPKFAQNKQQVDKAARGYKDINLNAFKIIKPGGYLMTFSCSGAISRDLFQKIVFGALADSGRQAQIVQHLSASDDHPVALTFPEGEYLKGLLLRVY